MNEDIQEDRWCHILVLSILMKNITKVSAGI